MNSEEREREKEEEEDQPATKEKYILIECMFCGKMSLFEAFKHDKKRAGLTGGGRLAGSYHNLFPKCQLFKPAYEYPLWDKDWDTHDGTRSKLKERDHQRHKQTKVDYQWDGTKYVYNTSPATDKHATKKKEVTRHIFLVRHGQYREDLESDDQHVLTQLGRVQARKTGHWLAEIIRKNNISTSVCKVKVLSCSSMVRAQQTAEIIYGEIDKMYEEHNNNNDNDNNTTSSSSCDDNNTTNNDVKDDDIKKWVPIRREEPDPMLMEGYPCHYIPSSPGNKVSQDTIDAINEDFPRMENAFQKYIARSEWLEELSNDSDDDADNANVDGSIGSSSNTNEREHEYQIIVTHANMIRYLTCRALQIPPECWLRLSLFNGSVTYLVVHAGGEVSLRSFGETGHMGYDNVTSNLYEG